MAVYISFMTKYHTCRDKHRTNDWQIINIYINVPSCLDKHFLSIPNSLCCYVSSQQTLNLFKVNDRYTKKKVWNMFKFNNKGTRIIQTFFWVRLWSYSQTCILVGNSNSTKTHKPSQLFTLEKFLSFLIMGCHRLGIIFYLGEMRHFT